MYKIKIVTKFNVINLEVEDINSPEVQEILSQPYIIETEIHREKEKVLKKDE